MSDFYLPKLIQHRRNCVNGNVVNANLWVALRNAQNHLMSFRHRQVYGRAWETTATTGLAATTVIARFRFRAGVGATKLAINVLSALSEINSGSPYIEVDVKISGGATTTVGPFACAIAPTGTGITDGPDEHLVGELYTAITSGTVYECAVRAYDYARIMSICAYELADPTTVDSSVNYYNEHQPTGGSPILDSDRQRIVEGLSEMYQANGAINFHWSLETGSARTRTSATFANAIDGTTTGTPTAGSSPGFYVDPRYRRTASRTVVPMEFSCYAAVAGGAGGTIRLIDTGGNVYGSTSITSATPAWYTTAFNLPESAEIFLAPQLASNGVSQCDLYAISAIEYE